MLFRSGLAKSQGLDFESDVQQSLARMGGLASDVTEGPARASELQALKSKMVDPRWRSNAPWTQTPFAGNVDVRPGSEKIDPWLDPAGPLALQPRPAGIDRAGPLAMREPPSPSPGSPVQAALRQMENRGVLQPGAGPAERVGVPEELLPAAREGVAEAMQAIPDDRQAY